MEDNFLCCKKCMYLVKENSISNRQGRVVRIFMCKRFPQSIQIDKIETHWCGEFEQSIFPKKHDKHGS